MYSLPETDDVVARALAEDFGVPPARFVPTAPVSPEILDRDVTTSSVLDPDATAAGTVVARQELVVAGLPVAARVWETLARVAGLPGRVEVFPLVAEGARVGAGRAVAEIDGLASVIYGGERAALNILMVLSGIATEAARWQTAAGPDLTVTDTRKTQPGLRALSKYAVMVGGAANHRHGLWDMVLVKDNHLRGREIPGAVEAAKTAHPGLPVEVEADTLAQAIEAARAGADIVLLDNMDDEALAAAAAAVREAATQAGRTCLVEASGGITFERIPALREIGVDRVSTSELTLARPVDLALDVPWNG